MVTTLITVAAIAWLTQLAFGGWQFAASIALLIAFASRGRVGVGRSSGRFKPRARLSLSPSMKTIVFAIRC